MKNFDEARAEREARDRSFQIGGETFSYRPAIAPEAILRWSQMTGGEMPDLTEVEAIEIFDETVVAFLEPGQDEKWARVRSKDAKHPINLADLRALVSWLFEEQTGRPTSQPSDSSGGPETEPTGTNSTDESRLQAVPTG